MMKKRKKPGRIIVIILLIAVICFSGFELWQISAIYVKEAQVKSRISEYRPDGASGHHGNPYDGLLYGPTEAEEAGLADAHAHDVGSTEREIVNQSIADLKNEITRDVVGWLTVPETHIDYPFVKAEDNDYYLRRDIYGNTASAGTLFMDFRCASDLTDFNTIIYGHNMKNETMFGDLSLFADEWFFNTNKYGTLFTEYGTYRLDIFALIVVSSEDKVIYNPNVDSVVFYDYVREYARTYREPDRSLNVVTLSTCGYEFSGARIVLLANLAAV